MEFWAQGPAHFIGYQGMFTPLMCHPEYLPSAGPGGCGARRGGASGGAGGGAGAGACGTGRAPGEGGGPGEAADGGEGQGGEGWGNGLLAAHRWPPSIVNTSLSLHPQASQLEAALSQSRAQQSKGEGAQRVVRLAFEKIKALQAQIDAARGQAEGAEGCLAGAEAAADRAEVRAGVGGQRGDAIALHVESSTHPGAPCPTSGRAGRGGSGVGPAGRRAPGAGRGAGAGGAAAEGHGGVDRGGRRGDTTWLQDAHSVAPCPSLRPATACRPPRSPSAGGGGRGPGGPGRAEGGAAVLQRGPGGAGSRAGPGGGGPPTAGAALCLATQSHATRSHSYTCMARPASLPCHTPCLCHTPRACAPA